ncbi:hypothetical protein IB237_23575 [Agrobacterium sp. AGB01]|uniref:COG3904 family protein n=1 Tax=Agrobacterium sp. AGB01 TaxID=2769302 RepID=UPI00177C7AA2|nr:hypothetical protein [Agrobacterium sp. AGB01]MBD9390186.1 hypothetical protein [Agrobacterium sp. AGB01]
MNFEYSEPQTAAEGFFGGFFHISAFGRIEEGDDEKFKKFLERVTPPPRTLVYINSGGGHVEAAIAIGRLIRQAWFSTSIGTYILDPQQPEDLIIPRRRIAGNCISAATLMFLGGRLRYLPDGSKFGVHQFSFKNPIPESIERSQRLSATIAAYIVEMGIPPAFLELSASTRGDQVQFVDEEQLKKLKVITGGMTEPTWAVELHAEAMWVRGERDSLWGHGKVILVYSKTDGFAFVALVETMGRHDELMNFPLVEIIANEEEIRIDITSRCFRAPSGIYTMFSANISNNEAHILANSKSFGIQIRGSAQAEIFLGISAISTEGAEGKLQGLYKIGGSGNLF